MTEDDAKHAALVEGAFARGQAALTAGERTEAVRWLDRAHRLAPYEGTIALSLASTLIGVDNARSAELFDRVLTAHDIRDAWAGLAMARFLLGDLAAARAALAETLSRHAPHPAVAALADRIAMETGAPGWCGLSGNGALTIRPTRPVPVEARIDGRLMKDGVPPRSWPKARRITVTTGREPFLGSPLSPRAIAMVDGYVEAGKDGLSGWAWCPADPGIDPILSITCGAFRCEIAATRAAEGLRGLPPLAMPRAFDVPWPPDAAVHPVHVRGPDGRGLTGGPVVREGIPTGLSDHSDPLVMARADRRSVKISRRLEHGIPPSSRHGPAQPGHPERHNAVGVVEPGHDAETTAPRGLTVIVRAPDAHSDMASIITAVPADAAILVVGGCDLARYRGRVTALEHDFASIAADHDLVWLDGVDSLPPDWLERLRAAVAGRVGTVTPLSNRGQAAYPSPEGVPLSWFGDTAARLDDLAHQANGMAAVTLPRGGGPCLFIRGECLAATGPIRFTLFGGDGSALTDFCARATALGWRHVAVTGLFIGQNRDPDTGAAAAQLRARNLARLPPAPPVATGQAWRRLDLARWRDEDRPEAAIIVTHDDGGGVERQIKTSAARHEALGRRAVILRPSQDQPGADVVVSDASGRRFPNLRFSLPREKAALARLLRAARPVEAEIHHILHHHPAVIETVRALKVPYDVHVHDFIWFCPRISLVGRRDRYCGEPDQTGCEACIAATESYLDEDISVAALRDRSRDLLTHARRVIAPSHDAAGRMVRHFPGTEIDVVPHEDDAAVPAPPPAAHVTGRVLVCVSGAIGLHKGYHVLLACARDARMRDLDLAFVVVGTTIDDQPLLDTGRVFVTGRYTPDEATTLLRAQGAALALLPSICPETWCLGLTELWRAGLRVVAFDTGAQAERIRRTGHGWLIPLASSPRGINDMLLNAARGRSLLPIRRSSAYKTAR